MKANILASALAAAALAAPAAPALADWSGHLWQPVYAHSSGTKFWNHTGYTLSCRFWTNDHGWYYDGHNFTGPDGILDLYYDTFPLTNCAAYSLVARDDNGNSWCIGSDASSILSYNWVDLWFFINEPNSDLSDNSGRLRVNYHCQALH